MNFNELMNNFFEKDKINEFELMLCVNKNAKVFLREFLIDVCFVGIIFSLILSSILLWFEFDFLIVLISSIGFFLLIFSGVIFFELFIFEKNRLKKENLVPDFLLAASIFPSGSSFETIIKELSNDFGLLGKELKLVLKKTETGVSLKNSFQEFKQRNKSSILNGLADLLFLSQESGKDFAKIFRENAEDLLEMQAVLRERNSAMIVQKYTLLLAGALIVPFILGTLSGLVLELGFFDFFGETSGENFLELMLLANQIYLIEYSLLASFFVAFQENSPKKAFIYALILIPLSLISYFLAGSF